MGANKEILRFRSSTADYKYNLDDNTISRADLATSIINESPTDKTIISFTTTTTPIPVENRIWENWGEAAIFVNSRVRNLLRIPHAHLSDIRGEGISLAQLKSKLFSDDELAIFNKKSGDIVNIDAYSEKPLLGWHAISLKEDSAGTLNITLISNQIRTFVRDLVF